MLAFIEQRRLPRLSVAVWIRKDWCGFIQGPDAHRGETPADARVPLKTPKASVLQDLSENPGSIAAPASIFGEQSKKLKTTERRSQLVTWSNKFIYKNLFIATVSSETVGHADACLRHVSVSIWSYHRSTLWLFAPYVYDQLNVILTLFRKILTILQPGTRFLSVNLAGIKAFPPIKPRSRSSEAFDSKMSVMSRTTHVLPFSISFTCLNTHASLISLVVLHIILHSVDKYLHSEVCYRLIKSLTSLVSWGNGSHSYHLPVYCLQCLSLNRLKDSYFFSVFQIKTPAMHTGVNELTPESQQQCWRLISQLIIFHQPHYPSGTHKHHGDHGCPPPPGTPSHQT